LTFDFFNGMVACSYHKVLQCLWIVSWSRHKAKVKGDVHTRPGHEYPGGQQMYSYIFGKDYKGKDDVPSLQMPTKSEEHHETSQSEHLVS
jgi:hypothetical protein